MPQLEDVSMGDQVLIVPPPLTEGKIRATFLNFEKSMTTQANALTSQVNAMTTQGKREVGLQVSQHAKTMSSRWRDFTRMSALMFFGSR